MLLRSRVHGRLVEACLELKKANSRSQFVLRIQDPSGRRTAIGRVEAAVGYTIARAASGERSALVLAGFHLRTSDPQLVRIAGVFRDLRRRKRAIAHRARRQLVPGAARSGNPACNRGKKGASGKHPIPHKRKPPDGNAPHRAPVARTRE